MFLSIPRIFFPHSQARSFLRPWMFLFSLKVRVLKTIIYFVAVLMSCAYSSKCIAQSGKKDVSEVWRGFVSCWSIEQSCSKAGCFLLYFWKYSVKLLILAECKLLEIKWNIKIMNFFFRACTLETGRYC